VCCSVLQCVAVCCSVLQCVAVCCSVLQCVAVCRTVPSGSPLLLSTITIHQLTILLLHVHVPPPQEAHKYVIVLCVSVARQAANEGGANADGRQDAIPDATCGRSFFKTRRQGHGAIYPRKARWCKSGSLLAAGRQDFGRPQHSFA